MAPWGWTDLARGFLILVASLAGGMLVGASVGRTPAPMAPHRLVVDANSAPPAVLGALPGIGPVLAGRIVEARSASPFRSLDDLDDRVKGIGPSRVAALGPFLRFESTAGPATATLPGAPPREGPNAP